MTQNSSVPEKPRTTGHAQHGPRTEVNWEGGSGRQPYANQGSVEGPVPSSGGDVSEGDRAARSGTNLEQIEEVKKKP